MKKNRLINVAQNTIGYFGVEHPDYATRQRNWACVTSLPKRTPLSAASFLCIERECSVLNGKIRMKPGIGN